MSVVGKLQEEIARLPEDKARKVLEFVRLLEEEAEDRQAIEEFLANPDQSTTPYKEIRQRLGLA